MAAKKREMSGSFCLKLSLVLATAVGIAAICRLVHFTALEEKLVIRVPIDWQRNLPRLEVGENMGTRGDLECSAPLKIQSIVPYARTVAERYHNALRLTFSTMGSLGGKPIEVRCDVVAQSKVVSAECLKLRLVRIEEVDIELFDAIGGAISWDTEAWCKYLRAELEAREIAFDGVWTDEKVQPQGATWFWTDCVEYEGMRQGGALQ